MSQEPLIFHCNHYNFWLQHTVLLVDGLGMEEVIREAAAAVVYNMVRALAGELGLKSPEEKLRLAADHFAQSGFGLMRFDQATERGGTVTTPVSHYGQCLSDACPSEFGQAQNIFDQGYAAGALTAAHDKALGSIRASTTACMSLGASEGIIKLEEGDGLALPSPGPGEGSDAELPPPNANTNVDESSIIKAVRALDFDGNEEGLIPRFGVMLTLHFANFYNRVSFEFVRRMQDTGVLAEGERLLVEAGHRCAFNTFGGIMSSAEWDAVVGPQCKSKEDWVHGMVAVTNCLGWGTWRVADLSADRLVLHVYDGYESRGYLGMFGKAERPVSYLACGGAAGLMNLVYNGDIHERPERSEDYYRRVFESERSFTATQTQCVAQGAPFTEIIASR